ncbi:MAG: hypothetical protein HQK63_02655 [Desulfamplus sp.]|nr:hypothetical protein [Desulfamplus sp.]
MELDNTNFCRRIITPWYESYLVSFMLILCSTSIFIFAIIGLTIAISTEGFHRYSWFPLVLAGLSCVIIIGVLFRIVRRNIKS